MHPSREVLDALLGFGDWTLLGLELLGALALCAGAIAAVYRLVNEAISHRRLSFTGARYDMARFLALALEFQLAADVLETAIAPEWAKIGKLAAIATIRTALNFFLSREMREEKAELDARAGPHAR